MTDLGELTPTTLLGMTNASRPMTARTKRREANKGLYLTNAPFLSNVPTGRLPRDLVPPAPTPDPSRASTPDAADWGVEGPSYVPTTHEIAHEADRLRLRRDLILRDEERAARLMERAAATGLDLRSRAEGPGFGEGPRVPEGSAVRVGARDDGRRRRPRVAAPAFSFASPARDPPSGRVWFATFGTEGRPRGGLASSSRRSSASMTAVGHTAPGAASGRAPATQSRYVIDFGNVPKGACLRRRFRVQNAGDEQMQWHWDKMALQMAGFKMFPENMPKLAGAPYYSSADVTLVLDTSLEHVTDGPIDVVVPVVVKGAPARR